MVDDVSSVAADWQEKSPSRCHEGMSQVSDRLPAASSMTGCKGREVNRTLESLEPRDMNLAILPVVSNIEES